MILSFYKYHGAGNDFIIVDNRNGDFVATPQQIAFLCHRHFGIGADGLMLISNHDTLDFTMQYFNSDGKEGSMCGNGGRCISAFYYEHISSKKNLTFMAIDGVHQAEILHTENNITQVCLHMNDVKKVEKTESGYLLDTGSPHLVIFDDNTTDLDILNEGMKIRYSEKYYEEGINVNFVEIRRDELLVRTYERGVEDETLSCGTGAVASAIAASLFLKFSESDITTRGGDLNVSFKKVGKSFTNVRLTGPAAFVFSGEIEY